MKKMFTKNIKSKQKEVLLAPNIGEATLFLFASLPHS